MTYEEAKSSTLPFNRLVYQDGWYYTDFRGVDCSCIDLSQRFWSPDDLKATDWVVQKATSAEERFDWKENIIGLDPNLED